MRSSQTCTSPRNHLNQICFPVSGIRDEFMHVEKKVMFPMKNLVSPLSPRIKTQRSLVYRVRKSKYSIDISDLDQKTKVRNKSSIMTLSQLNFQLECNNLNNLIRQKTLTNENTSTQTLFQKKLLIKDRKNYQSFNGKNKEQKNIKGTRTPHLRKLISQLNNIQKQIRFFQFKKNKQKEKQKQKENMKYTKDKQNMFHLDHKKQIQMKKSFQKQKTNNLRQHNLIGKEKGKRITLQPKKLKIKDKDNNCKLNQEHNTNEEKKCQKKAEKKKKVLEYLSVDCEYSPWASFINNDNFHMNQFQGRFPFYSS